MFNAMYLIQRKWVIYSNGLQYHDSMNTEYYSPDVCPCQHYDVQVGTNILFKYRSLFEQTPHIIISTNIRIIYDYITLRSVSSACVS